MKLIYAKNVYELRETPNDILDAFRIPHNEEQKLFKNWLFLIVSPVVLNKNHTRRQRLQLGWVSMNRYQFLFRQIWSKNLLSFALPIPIILSHLFYCSRRISYPKLNSDEINIHGTWDSNQDKAVQTTGTAEPKTQPSRNSEWLCRCFCS